MKKLYNIIEIFYDYSQKIFKKESGDLNFLGKGLKILIIVCIIKVLIKLVNGAVDKTLKKRRKSLSGADERKVQTLSAVLKSVIKYLLYFIGIVNILDIFKINTSSVLATAGIGGLAIGFGAQSLVKDIITGFFILLEDQFSVGDHVELGKYEGIVEEMGVRVTKLRDFSGELHIIPNSNITIVTNKTRGAMRAMVTVSIAYEEDISRSMACLEKACLKIKAEEKNVIEGPSVIGVSNLNDTGVEITIVAKTQPMEQWGVERRIRKEAKEALERENIEIPYPRLVLKQD